MRNDQIDEAQMAADFATLPDPVNGHMRRARALVEAHISEYGMVPHPDKIKEAIAVELGLAEMRGIDRMRDAITKLAAECHRAKWAFDLSEDYRPTAAAARGMIRKGFDELHRIGDLALEYRKPKGLDSP